MNIGSPDMWWRAGATVAGLLLIVFGVGVLGYQVRLWLEHGGWTPFELRSAWQWLAGAAGVTPAPEPSFSWLGVQKIALWTLSSPLSGGMMILGLCTVLMGTTNLFKYLGAAALVVAWGYVIFT